MSKKLNTNLKAMYVFEISKCKCMSSFSTNIETLIDHNYALKSTDNIYVFNECLYQSYH